MDGPEPAHAGDGTRGFDPNPGDDALAVDADQSRNAGDHNLWLFRRIAARDLFADRVLQLVTSAW